MPYAQHIEERYSTMLRTLAAITGGFTVSGGSTLLFKVLGASDLHTDGSNIWVPFTLVVVVGLFVGGGIWKVAFWVRDLQDLVKVGNNDAAAAKTIANKVSESLDDFRRTQHGSMDAIGDRIKKIEEHCAITHRRK